MKLSSYIIGDIVKVHGRIFLDNQPKEGRVLWVSKDNERLKVATRFGLVFYVFRKNVISKINSK